MRARAGSIGGPGRKIRYCDSPFWVVETSDDFAKRLKRIMNSTPEITRMEIVAGTPHLEFHAQCAPQRISDRWAIRAEDSHVRNHRSLGGQRFPVHA